MVEILADRAPVALVRHHRFHRRGELAPAIPAPLPSVRAGRIAQQVVGQTKIGRRNAQELRHPDEEADIADLPSPPLDHRDVGLVDLQHLAKRVLRQAIRSAIVAQNPTERR